MSLDKGTLFWRVLPVAYDDFLITVRAPRTSQIDFFFFFLFFFFPLHINVYFIFASCFVGSNTPRSRTWRIAILYAFQPSRVVLASGQVGRKGRACV